MNTFYIKQCHTIHQIIYIISTYTVQVIETIINNLSLFRKKHSSQRYAVNGT